MPMGNQVWAIKLLIQPTLEALEKPKSKTVDREDYLVVLAIDCFLLFCFQFVDFC